MSGAVVREEPRILVCEGARLLAIAHLPAAPRRHGVVMVVGGPQYRIGSHRQHLELARALAKAGYPVLRFDYRGMGDSEGAHPGFEAITPDIRCAVDAMAELVPGLDGVVLWGLCDAATAISHYAAGDRRIAGIALLNPWVREEHSYDQTLLRHYYTRRVLDKAFWHKLATGRVQFGDFPRLLARTAHRAVRGASAGALGLADAADVPLATRVSRGLARYAGPVLLVLSGDDMTAREFEQAVAKQPQWRSLAASERLSRQDLPGADHTFTDAAAANGVARATLDWLQGF